MHGQGRQSKRCSPLRHREHCESGVPEAVPDGPGRRFWWFPRWASTAPASQRISCESGGSVQFGSACPSARYNASARTANQRRCSARDVCLEKRSGGQGRASGSGIYRCYSASACPRVPHLRLPRKMGRLVQGHPGGDGVPQRVHARRLPQRCAGEPVVAPSPFEVHCAPFKL